MAKPIFFTSSFYTEKIAGKVPFFIILIKVIEKLSFPDIAFSLSHDLTLGRLEILLPEKDPNFLCPLLFILKNQDVFFLVCEKGNLFCKHFLTDMDPPSHLFERDALRDALFVLFSWRGKS